MIWILLLPLLILFPYLNSVILRPGSEYSDLLISHLPNAVYIRQAIETWGQIPLWSPTILSGYPLYANPLSGLWYPPAWLGVLLPEPLGFNLLFGLHLLLAGFGIFAWLRSEGLRATSALTAAIVFEGMPKIWIHYAAGHVSLLYAVCWTPWLLYCETRAHQPGANRMWRYTPGFFLGLILLADPRWIVYAGPLWVAYLFWKSWSPVERAPGMSLGIRIGTALRGWLPTSILRVLANLLMAGMIASPLLLPLAQFTQYSTRANLSVAEANRYSLDWQNLIQFFLPNPTGEVETSFYPTMVGLLCLVLCIFSTRLRAVNRFWLALAGIAVLLALGSSLPLVNDLPRIAILNLVRVPSRALFLLGLATSVLVGSAVEALLTASPGEFRIGRGKPVLGLIVILEIALLVCGWVAYSNPEKRQICLWGFGWALVSGITLVLRLYGKIPARTFWIIILASAILEPAWFTMKTFEPRRLEDLMAEKDQVFDYLKSQEPEFRTYSPSYSLPQELAAAGGLWMADGVDPLQLTAYRDFMEAASGVPAHGYSVTLPPFETGKPDRDNRAYVPDARLLGWLNIRYILSEYRLDASGLELKARFGNTRIYENAYAYPRVWIQADTLQVDGPIRLVQEITWSPNQIDIVADGPGRLVLSEIDYPDWTAQLDGKAVEIEAVAGILRSVSLEPGRHEVRFTLRPASLRLGLILACLTILTWGCAWIYFLIRTRPRKNTQTQSISNP